MGSAACGPVRPAPTPRRSTTRRSPTRSPSTTTRCSPRSSTGAAPSPDERLRRRSPRRPRAALVHPVFFGSARHRRRRRRAHRAASPSCCRQPTTTPAVRCRAPSSRSSAARAARRSPTCGCSRGTRPRARPARPATASGKVTGDRGLRRRRRGRRARGRAGQIGQLCGPRRRPDRRRDRHARREPRAAPFAPPTLETVVAPRSPSRPRARCTSRSTELAEQDPLIDLRHDECAASCRSRSTARCRRRSSTRRSPRTSASTVAFERDDDDLRRATGRLRRGGRVDRRRTATRSWPRSGCGSSRRRAATGVAFGLEVELGSMPLAFFKAVEETSRRRCGRRPARMARSTDCARHDDALGLLGRAEPRARGFDKSMSSTARDFRDLTPLVLLRALEAAGTQVCEPVHRFELELPDDTLGPVLPRSAGSARARRTGARNGDCRWRARSRRRASTSCAPPAGPHARRGRAGDRVRPLPADAR